MCASELALECTSLAALWLPVLPTFDQCRAIRLDLYAAHLLSPNEITDIFGIVGSADFGSGFGSAESHP